MGKDFEIICSSQNFIWHNLFRTYYQIGQRLNFKPYF